MILDIGIGFVTGRKHFKNVLTSYINNWLEHGLLQDKNIRLHLFTHPDQYEGIIKDMRQKLELTVPKLCRYFKNHHFEQILHELEHCHNNVKRHFISFQYTKIAWQKVMQNIDGKSADNQLADLDLKKNSL